jgi:hypothetical protein
MTPIRVLAVGALIFHAIGLFAIPHLAFLFSPDVRELMKYGGHGATINPTHPIVYALWLLPYPALVAIFLGLNWGRYLLLTFYVVLALASFYLGASVSGPPESFIAIVGSLLDGAVLGLAFFGTQALRAQPSNNLMQPTGRERPAAD